MDTARANSQTPKTPTSTPAILLHKIDDTTTEEHPPAAPPPLKSPPSNVDNSTASQPTTGPPSPHTHHRSSTPQAPRQHSNPISNHHAPKVVKSTQRPIHRNHHHLHHRRKFAHLLQPLHPLLSIQTGLPHPSFPRSLLAYHLLSHAQLDSLAAHYHQLEPGYYSLGYPAAVVGRWWVRDSEDGSDGGRLKARGTGEGAREMVRNVLGDSGGERGMGEEMGGKEEGEEEIKLREGKRRRFGRFIGMRGCESPGIEAGEDEEIMASAMEAWVGGEMARRALERGFELGEKGGKGVW